VIRLNIAVIAFFKEWDIWLEDEEANIANVISSGGSFSLNYRVRFHVDIVQPIFAMMIKTREGVALYGTDTSKIDRFNRHFNANEVVHARFALKGMLAPGTYYINCGLRDDGQDSVQFIHRRVDAAIFRITASQMTTTLTGLIDMSSVIELN
jgi:lipopolysaccharide transport system ATP-binding protein